MHDTWIYIYIYICLGCTEMSHFLWRCLKSHFPVVPVVIQSFWWRVLAPCLVLQDDEDVSG